MELAIGRAKLQSNRYCQPTSTQLFTQRPRLLAVIYTFIHHEGSKYMKTIRKTNNRQETMYMTGREIDRRFSPGFSPLVLFIGAG